MNKINKEQILAILNEIDLSEANRLFSVEYITKVEQSAINTIMPRSPKLALAWLVSTKHEGFKEELASLMEEKNALYGFASLNPKRVVSTREVTPKDSIAMRIDDKIARYNNTPKEKDTEDTVMDIIGYLVLYIHVM